MKKFKLVAMLATLALAVGMGSALADTQNGSTEHVEGDNGTEYTNDVQCGEVDGDDGDVPDADTPLVNVYTTGSPETQSGEVEVCNDGSDAPEETSGMPGLEGRIYVSGSVEDGGAVAIDGDKDNEEDERLQGWAAVDVDPRDSEAPVSYACGDPEGNLDSTHRTDADNADECNPEPPA